MVEFRTRNTEMRGDGGNHHENLGPREYYLGVNIPSLIWRAQVPIRRIITQTWGLPITISQVVPRISDILLEFSISFPSSSLISLSHPHLYHYRVAQSSVFSLYFSMQWSWVNTVYSIYWVQHLLSTAFPEYSIYWVQHEPKTLSTQDSLCYHRSQDYQLALDVASAPGEVPYKLGCHQGAPYESSKVKSSRHITPVASYCN
jgi:hypothetical protein